MQQPQAEPPGLGAEGGLADGGPQPFAPLCPLAISLSVTNMSQGPRLGTLAALHPPRCSPLSFVTWSYTMVFTHWGQSPGSPRDMRPGAPGCPVPLFVGPGIPGRLSWAGGGGPLRVTHRVLGLSEPLQHPHI